MPNGDEYQSLDIGTLQRVLADQAAEWKAESTVLSQLSVDEKKRRLGVAPPI